MGDTTTVSEFVEMIGSIRDSGQRTEFMTGSRRDLRDGKGRFDLLPPYPLWRIALHFEGGSEKYGDRNWEKGQPTHCYYDSAMRHMVKYMLCRQLGIDGDEDHLAAAAWNIICLMHTEWMIQMGLLPDELDTLPHGLPNGRETPDWLQRMSADEILSTEANVGQNVGNG